MSGKEELLKALAAKQQRSAEDHSQIAWEGIGRFGMVGWSITLPILGGLLLGWFIDNATGHGHFWMTMLFFAGLIFGCISTAYWLFRECDEIGGVHKP